MHKLIKHQRPFSVTEWGLGWVETQGCLSVSTHYLQDTVLNKYENKLKPGEDLRQCVTYPNMVTQL